jgi:hypothetical protein
MNDPFCYQAAVDAVIDALAVAQPVVYESAHLDPDVREQHQRLFDYFASLAARGVAVTSKLKPNTAKETGEGPS